MRKTALTPEEIEAGGFSPLTKQKYLLAWKIHIRGKTLAQERKEIREKIKNNAHLPLKDLIEVVGITRKSIINIACKHKIKLNSTIGRPRGAVLEKASIVRKEIQDLADKGYSRIEIREVLNLTAQQLRSKLTYYGIKVCSDTPKGRPKSKEPKPPKEPKAKAPKPVKIKELKIKPVKVRKVKAKQVVEKEKKVAQIVGKSVKRKEKTIECKVRDFSGMKMVNLGVNRMSFYVPASFTQEQIEAEKNKRLQKLKQTA